MGDAYLDLARQGKNAWWRYLLSIVVVPLVWFVLLALMFALFAVAVSLDGDPSTAFDLATGAVGVDPAVLMARDWLTFPLLLLSLLVAIRFIHKRPLRSLITPLSGFDWGRAATGFGLMVILAAGSSLVEAVLYPGRYELTWDPNEFFKYVPLVLILVPLQSATEELLFRGYLMQSIGLLIRRALVPAIVSSLVFMALHLANPEVAVNALLMPAYYFISGIFFAVIALKDNRLELAIGAHAGGNVFGGLLVTYPDSALQAPAIFTTNELDAVYGLLSLVVSSAVFYVALFGREPLQLAVIRATEAIRARRDMRQARTSRG